MPLIEVMLMHNVNGKSSGKIRGKLMLCQRARDGRSATGIPQTTGAHESCKRISLGVLDLERFENHCPTQLWNFMSLSCHKETPEKIAQLMNEKVDK